MRVALRSRLLLLGGAAVVLAADQLSKYWVVTTLPEQVPVDVIPWLRPILSFTYVKNTGAAFGLFPQLSGLFVMLAVLVVMLIFFFYRTLPVDDWLMHLALGLQVGGALGNLVDRLQHGGAVIDFLDANFWPFHNFPIFNLADSAIVVGVALLILATYLEQRREVQQQKLSQQECSADV